MAQKFELKAGMTRVTITRADGSTMVLEAGEEREPKNAEDRALLEADPHVKQVEKGGSK